MTRSGHFSRSPLARVIDHGADTFVLASDGTAQQVSGDSAQLLRAIFDYLGAPHTRDEVLAHLEQMAGAPIDDATAIDEALELLDRAGAIAPPLHPAPAAARGRLVLCVTGAVAASGAPDLVSRLLGAGFEVRVAMSRDARRFVSPLVLEAITHQPISRSLWNPPTKLMVPHIALAEWAQLVLVCPASATTLSRIATGDCSDLVSAIAIGTRAPRVIVPSMNPALLHSAAVQRNLSQLSDDGAWLVHTGYGHELAHAPTDRAPIAGAMPPHAAIVDLACFVASRPASGGPA